MSDRKRRWSGALNFVSNRRAKMVVRNEALQRSEGTEVNNDCNIEENDNSDNSFPGALDSGNHENISPKSGITDTIDQSWREGRRIVELGYLADQLKCTDCGENLQG